MEFIKGDTTGWTEEFRFKKKDGSYAYVIDRGFVIRDEKGRALRMVGALQDITKRKQDEFALQQSEARHRGIIASQTNYVIRTDLEGNYTYYNQKFIDDFGWIHEKENLMGINCMASIMPYHHQATIETVTKCFENLNEVFQVEIDKPIKGGGIRTTVWDFICLTDSNGQPTEMQCVGIDISERKKAQTELIKTLEEKNTILESIADGFFAVDKNWMITYWNHHAEIMLKRTKEEVLGRPFSEIYKERPHSESLSKFRQAMETNTVVAFEEFYEKVFKWYDISAYPSSQGLSVYLRDITERKKIEVRLNELIENLTRQAKELAVSNAELEQFAYVASHDLQEPLRMVTSFLTLLENRYGNALDEKASKYIHFAVDGAKRMRQIILDLLEFSRVGRNKENEELIDLNDIISEIKILFRSQIEEKNALIFADKLPLLKAYKSPLRQVFQNLIGNALKYTRSGVLPEINIKVKELEGAWQFEIIDNGIGIDKEYYDKIFIIFQRLHHKDEFSGTGIGLAIAKKIIENMSGKIWLESEEGKGTTFYFTLPKRVV